MSRLPSTPSPGSPSPRDRPDEAAQLRRASIVPMVVALVAVAGLAVYIFWQQNRPMPKPLAQPEVLLSQSEPIEDSGLYDPLSELSGRSSVSDMISLRESDVALSPEDAPLEAYPGAVWIGGVARTDAAGTETMAQWHVPEMLPATVEAYYLAAAQKRGFVLLEVAPIADAPTAGGAAGAVHTRHMMRGRNASTADASQRAELLTLRIAPMPGSQDPSPDGPPGAGTVGGSSVLIWLRELPR